MIADTCEAFNQMGGICGVNVMLMLTCGTCNKRKECHAEIRKTHKDK